MRKLVTMTSGRPALKGTALFSLNGSNVVIANGPYGFQTTAKLSAQVRLKPT